MHRHSLTHWQASSCLTNNDFFSAVTLTMFLSCLFSPPSIPFPTFLWNTLWLFSPCVYLFIFQTHSSHATFLPKWFALPVISNISSTPICWIVVQPGKGLTSCITMYLPTTVSPWLVSLATCPALTSQRTRIMTVFGLLLVTGLPHFLVRYLGHNLLTWTHVLFVSIGYFCISFCILCVYISLFSLCLIAQWQVFSHTRNGL